MENTSNAPTPMKLQACPRHERRAARRLREMGSSSKKRLPASHASTAIATCAPIVEHTPLFVRSIGEVTDIVEKEMYSFEDKLNGEKLTLRPELTAGWVRAAISQSDLQRPGAHLLAGRSVPPRAPQKGRYRQFNQFDVECFGFDGPDVDAGS